MYALLGFKDLKNLDNTIYLVELKSLKFKFKNAKYLIVDKVSAVTAKLLAVLDTHLYWVTKCDARSRELSIILSSNFMQLLLSDDIFTKVVL